MGEGHATFNRNVGVGKETFLAMASAYQRIYLLFFFKKYLF